jgi:hypothetical protein
MMMLASKLAIVMSKINNEINTTNHDVVYIINETDI